MTPRLRKTILFSLLGLSYGFFSYNFFGGWWNSSFGTILILFFSYLIWKKDFLRHVGLQVNFKTFATSIILAVIVTICALLIMKHIAAKQNVEIGRASCREKV
mgnify:FL=1